MSTWDFLLYHYTILFLCITLALEVTQSCPTFCDPTDCSLPGSSVHGIFQARVLEGVAVSFSRRSFQPGMEPGSPTFQADALLS